jgi:hypothetical protein
MILSTAKKLNLRRSKEPEAYLIICNKMSCQATYLCFIPLHIKAEFQASTAYDPVKASQKIF